MSPTITMSREFTAWLAGQKMNRANYDKWKTHEQAAAERAKDLTPMHKMTCAQCGTEFEHENKNVIVCSEKCRKARKRDQDIRCKSGHGRTGQIASCRYCGKKYTVNGTTQKFCSPKCRKGQENRLKRNNSRTLPATCIICGQGFLTSPNTKAKTCGGECLQKYRSMLTRDRIASQKMAGQTNAFGEFCMPCPWEAGKLDTLPPGVASWDCAEMDPLSGGFPMITFSVPSTAREVAA